MIALNIAYKSEDETIGGGNHQQCQVNLIALTDKNIYRAGLLLCEMSINIQ